MICPTCNSDNIKKNGHTHNKKQNYMCKNCSRQLIENPEKTGISKEKKDEIATLFLERLSVRGICRSMGVSLTWLLESFVDITNAIPDDLVIQKPEKSKLTIEIDEMWSFVGKKKNKKWIWLAIDRNSGQIIGFYIGNRDRKSAKKLWESLPGVYRQFAVFYTDFWESYEQVIPENRHRAVRKDSGQTNHIERENCTLRQCNSKLVRKTLSFSKKLENHIRSIKFLIWHYNIEKLAAMA